MVETVEIKKGQQVELTIDDLANGGDGVGHLQGLAVFVPGSIPGERVLVQITSRKKSYARGRLIEVIKAAEERVIPSCPLARDCGGCQLQHIDYQAQLTMKRKVVVDLLERVGGLTGVEVKEVIGADYPWNYRNKAQLPLTEDKKGQLEMGFFRQGTHQVEVIDSGCNIQHPLINRIAGEALKVLNSYQLPAYNEQRHSGLLRHLLIRVGVCTNQALLTIITRHSLPHKGEIARQIMENVPELSGVLQNINRQQTNVILGERTELIRGQDYYLDYIGPVKFAISTESFFQVNTLQAEKLYQTVLDFAGLKGRENVLDAYSGIGSIALYLARRAGKVLGIEEIERAVVDARKNAGLNNIDNCTFELGRVEERLPTLIEEGYKPELVIFDPPRKGLDKRVIEAVTNAAPEKIVYVSCNPATLARDLALFSTVYQIVRVQPVDMFPQTFHIESVVLLIRK